MTRSAGPLVGAVTDAVAHRAGTARLSLADPSGRPLAATEVVVGQERHELAFGTIGFDLVALANGRGRPGDQLLADRFRDLFDWATLPYYWRQVEPEPGALRTDELLRAAEWLRARGIRSKGHPLVWHTLAPEWLRGRPVAEIEAAVRARIRRDVGAAVGVVDVWDVVNEAVIMPRFTAEPNAITELAAARGRVELVRLAVEEARAANPDVVLVLNDFDLSPGYERLVADVLDAGIRIDAVGIQTHMHQGYRGEERTRDVLDRFARSGLPLHLTETSLVSGDPMPPHIVDLNDWQPETWPSTPDGEARQADEIRRHYRTLVGHPAVAAITYWGLTDRDAWLGAPVGLLREEGGAKPSYGALRSLIRGEWWLEPTAIRTDAAGRIDVRGFAGDYRVHRAGAADAAAAFAVRRGAVDDLTLTL